MTSPSKNHHRGRLFLVFLFIGMALGLLVHRYTHQSAPSHPAATTPIVVAAKNIPAGSVLRPEVLTVIQLPTEIVPPQSVQTPQQLIGRHTTVPLVPGEPILLPKLRPEGLPPASPTGRRVAALGDHLLAFPSEAHTLWQKVRSELARRQIW